MSIRHRSSRALFIASLRLATIPLATIPLATSARADDDALVMYRDRFRIGMEKYKSGAVAEAIRVWSAIYEEIGPKRGYRLSFNLGRAFDTNGEATRAAERYRSFLDEAAARRNANDPIEPIVERETQEAEARIVALNQEHGRIEIATGARATLARVDDADPRLGAFTAYVAPGKHVVTFGSGGNDAEKVDVTIAAGELVVVRATAPLTPWSETVRTQMDPIPMKHVTKRPFSPVVLYSGAVATVVSVIAPIWAYAHAYSLIDTYTSTTASQTTKTSAYASYPAARNVAYGTLVLPIALGAATGVLTTWYFAGSHEHDVPVTLGVGPVPGGFAASLSAKF